MKILYLRHAESIDDLTDQYGGWGDFSLTPKGENQIAESANKIKELGISFSKIYTSNLLRAKQSASILSSVLRIPAEDFVYLREMNKYGILSGVNKEQAKQSYPELTSKLENNEYILGAESYDELKERALNGLEILFKKTSEDIIVLSHGNFLKCALKEKYNIEIERFGDGGFVIVEDNKIIAKNEVIGNL